MDIHSFINVIELVYYYDDVLFYSQYIINKIDSDNLNFNNYLYVLSVNQKPVTY